MNDLSHNLSAWSIAHSNFNPYRPRSTSEHITKRSSSGKRLIFWKSFGSPCTVHSFRGIPLRTDGN